MTQEEFLERFRTRKLKEGEQVSSFDCGDNDLNEFILNDANLYLKQLLAVTYIIEEKTSGNVIAFFSLANDRISIDDFPSNNIFNRFRKALFVQKKRMKSYPAAKICRLGVDKNLRSSSIGTYLLTFIQLYFLNDNKTGCRFLTVDAYREATPFYIKNGFSYLTDEEKISRTQLLYFDLNEVES